MQLSYHQNQHQTRNQGYYLSIQHMQFMHLLHLSGYALDEYLQNQLEENPLLELNEKAPEENTGEVDTGEDSKKESEGDAEVLDDDFFDEDEFAGEKYYSSQQSDEDVYRAPVTQFDTLTEQLKSQIEFMNITPEQRRLANYIVDELEDDGYLKRASKDIAFDYSFSTGQLIYEEEVEKAIQLVQQCEPAGTGARTLQECLLIQLGKRKEKSIFADTALKMIREHYDKLISRNFQGIINAMGITNEQFKGIMELIQTLNPRPNTSPDKNELIKEQITPS